MKRSVLNLLIALMFLNGGGMLIGAVPNFFSYQGRLTTPSGDSVADGSYDVIFTVYDAAAGGAVIWSSGVQSVTTVGGAFSINLGAPPMTVLPSNLSSDSSRYLGVTVGNDPEMSPRIKLGSAVFSMNSVKSDTANLARSVYIGDSTMIADNIGIRIGSATQPSASTLLDVQRSWNTAEGRIGQYLRAYNAGAGGVNGMQINAGAAGGQPGDVAGLIVNASCDGPNRTAIYGVANSAGSSVGASFGVLGSASLGTDVYGVFGTAVTGTNCYGVYGFAIKQANSYAGYFDGHVNITGTLTKAAGAFRIDHPLDPEHKFLQHSFVESPDMMNIYNGNVTTDAKGLADVVLPDYFESLNRDFRYQLTVIGEFAQAIIKSEISANHFTIQTDRPNIKVSWQVTGVRKDAFANANRIQVEVEKSASEMGKYQNPEAFGLPLERGSDFSRASHVIR